MDYNQYLPFLLLIVIIVLYNLYRIKKKKLIEEEQKYIGTFLLKDQDISFIKTGSPFKTANISPNKTIIRNETEIYSKSFESPISNRNQTKSFKKGSPSAKSPIIQGKLSPLGFGEIFQEKIYSLSPKEILRRRESIKDHSLKNLSFETIKLNKISEEKIDKTLKVVENNQNYLKKNNSQINLNLRFQEFENNQALGEGKTSSLKKTSSIQYATTLESNSQIGDTKEGRNSKLGKDNFQENEICDIYSDKEKMKNLTTGAELFMRKDKKQIIQHKEYQDQFETKNDSSFEIECDFEGKSQEDEIKKLPLTNIKFQIDYLTEFNSGLKLKKYIAKKIVQEYSRETHSIPKSMSQLTIQTLEQKPSIGNVGQLTGTGNQSIQTSKLQGNGSLLQNSSSLNKPSNDTDKLKQISSNPPANSDNKSPSLLGSQSKPENQNNNQMKQSGLFGNTGENKTQITPQNKVSAPQNTIAQGQNKEMSDKPKPQIQTSDLFKTNTEDKKTESILNKNSGSNNSTPMFAKGGLDSSTSGKPRSNAIDFSDKEENVQKKIK